MPTMDAAADPDWTLFADWCASRGIAPLPAALADVEAFLVDLPASGRTVRRRRHSIRSRHLAAGYDDPAPRLDSQAPDEARRSAALELLPSCIVRSWPDGIRGRRDGFILAAIGVAALTRRQIRALRAADIAFDTVGVHVRGARARIGETPGVCPACAVTRWLRILDIAQRRGWTTVRSIMAGQWPTTAEDDRLRHDCRRPLRGDWRSIPALLPAIDQHGWTVNDDTAVSTRTISEVTAGRLHPPAGAVAPPREEYVRSDWSRTKQAEETADLDPLFDRLEREIDAAARRAQALVDGMSG